MTVPFLGKITVATYSKPSAELSSLSSGEANLHFLLEDDKCGQVTVPTSAAQDWLEMGLKYGNCKSQGFTYFFRDEIVNYGNYEVTMSTFVRPSLSTASVVGKKKCQAVKTIGKSFSLDKFISKSWFVQYQQENGYQKKNSLFCVAATYDNSKKQSVPFFSGPVISVYNYANKGGVNKSNQNDKDGMVLCARAANKDPSKLLVAPCFLPNGLAGNYWVLDAGVDAEGEYTWALISGGQPTVQYDDGTCSTKETGTYGATGMWIFTRERVASKETVDAAFNAMAKQGIHTGRMIKAEQEGCNYSGAFIKD